MKEEVENALGEAIAKRLIAEAKLELARPLLDAVMKWDGESFLWDDVGKEALIYRAKRGTE